MSDHPGTDLLPGRETSKKYRSSVSSSSAHHVARSRVGGAAGSLLVHGLLALLASLSLTHGTGRGPAGTPGNGVGEAGAASPGFEVSVREGAPDLSMTREPEAVHFGKVSPPEPSEVDPSDMPDVPFDAFAMNDDALPRDVASRPVGEVERPAPRPPSARELLPKGLPGGAGEAPEGSLSDSAATQASKAPAKGNGPAGQGLGSGGSGDGSLVAVYNPKPEYPVSARRRNIEGVSVVEITIDVTGAVTAAKIAESSGNEALDQAAVETIKRWKYERKAAGAALLPITERIRFVFRLDP